jgi:hypothetical protein
MERCTTGDSVMGKKIVKVVNYCCECPYQESRLTGVTSFKIENYCKKAKKMIDDSEWDSIIPDWCPLETVKVENE